MLERILIGVGEDIGDGVGLAIDYKGCAAQTLIQCLGLSDGET